MMINRSKLLLTGVYFILILSCPAISHGNGAVWNPGTKGGTPGPIKHHDLILERERVIFKSNDSDDGMVHAMFWIKNPTDKKIHVTMGFPLDYKEKQEHLLNQGYSILETDNFFKTFEVSVNGGKITTNLTKDIHNAYPIVYTWEMTFPPKATIEVTVNYAMLATTHGRDGVPESNSDYSFTYITHTGAYWSQSIREAVFEFHGKWLVDFIGHEFPGAYVKWTSNGWGKTEKTYSIKPKPFDIDHRNSSIIWKRENWKPQKNVDDIHISQEISDTSYHYGCVDSSCSGLNYLEDYMSKWCGKPQFGDSIGILKTRISRSNWGNILGASYRYSHNILNAEKSDKEIYDESIENLPIHLKTDFQLWVLRYLRNYIAAAHGHEFRDSTLSKCFENVTPIQSDHTQTEKYNLDFISNLEKELKPINISAWNEVRGNLSEK